MKKRLVAIAAASMLVFSACSGNASDKKDTASDAKTIVNCGVELDISKPAERVVAVEQGAIATMLDMGQIDKLAGYSHLKEKVPTQYEEQFAKINKLSDKPATAEQIRTAEPDLVFTNFKVNYTADKVGTRDEWKKLGVKTFLSNTECPDEGDNKGLAKFELLEKDFVQLGQLMGVEAEGKSQAKALKEAVENAKKNAATDNPTFAVVYSMYNGVPYIGGKLSLAEDMINAVGGKNVFNDVNDAWPEVSWESLASKNPDYLILVDLPARGKPGDTWQEKADTLKNEAAVKNMDAVVKERFIPVSGGGFDPATVTSKSINEMIDGYKKLQNK